ncbi:MAG: VCBS repeat-containing protein [Planctomycetales bacterium]|nr:VCBS repeat-containing protein [Planctomycetales bacterium]
MNPRHLSLEQLENKTVLTSIAFASVGSSAEQEWAAEQTKLADVDRNGTLDVVALEAIEGNLFGIAGGSTNFANPELLSEDIFTSFDVQDLDGDGDVDIVASQASQLVWLPNDGDGNFGPIRAIGSLNGVAEVRAVDMDADGDLDLLARTNRTSIFSNFRIVAIKNTDGKGSFGEWTTVVNSASGGYTLDVGDVDADGDVDIITTTSEGFVFHPNLDGLGQFGHARTLLPTLEPIGAVAVADINGDARTDIAFASFSPASTVLLTSNADGSWSQTRLLTNAPVERALQFGDLDNDGDQDLVFGNGDYLIGGQLSWLENQQGEFNSTAQVWSSAQSGFVDIELQDLDADGDLDIFAVSNSLVSSLRWFQNRPVGDSNNDGVFDTSDLIRVFQAGQYEDGVAKNSSFDEGDWNGDGEFDTADMVFAFQAATFVKEVSPLNFDHAVGIDSLFASAEFVNRRFSSAKGQSEIVQPLGQILPRPAK